MRGALRLFVDLDPAARASMWATTRGRFLASFCASLEVHPTAAIALALAPGQAAGELPRALSCSPRLTSSTALSFRKFAHGGDSIYVILDPLDAAGGAHLLPPVVVEHGVSVAVLLTHVSTDAPARDGRRFEARRGLVRQADVVLTPSDAVRAQAIASLDLVPQRVHTIGAAASDSFEPATHDVAVTPDQAPCSGVLRPFVLGGVRSERDAVYLIDRWAELPLDLRDAHQLVLVGDGSAELDLKGVASRRAFARALVPHDVVLVDRPAIASLRRLYQRARLFVSPPGDGTGLAALEAARAACPVLYIGAGAPSPLLSVRAAPLVEQEAVKEAIARCLRDASHRKELVQRSHAATASCSWERIVDRTIRALQQAPAPRVAEPPLRLALVTPVAHQRVLGALGRAAAEAPRAAGSG